MIPMKEFFGAGRAKFTIEVPSDFQQSQKVQPHYTFKIDHVDANDKWPEAWFVKLLVGPDNGRDYRTFGMFNPKTGQIRLTRKTNLTDESWPVRLLRRSFANIFGGTPERILEAGFQVMHVGRCGRCGRELTVPSSIETGLGPICVAKV